MDRSRADRDPRAGRPRDAPALARLGRREVERDRRAVDDRGHIKVDDQLRTNVPGIWALGDCNGRGAFTHTSYNDFEIVAANLLDHKRRRVSDRIPAYALYTDPPLGRVGMTEAEVRRTGRPAMIGPGMSTFVDFLVVVLELFDAFVRSFSRTVSVSPTRRATAFSNNATSCPA